MGGNIWKEESVRLDRKQYFDLEKEVLEKLRSYFKGVKMAPIKAYREKPSFGDMDIVVCSGKFSSKIIGELFNLKQNHTSSNGNNLSFLYKDFQIDLIFVSEDNYNISLDYFAWNDLGNLIGRVSRKLGLKYGHDGLSARIIEGSELLSEVSISKDTIAILTFLGYDYETFNKGFDTLEDIFRFVASSKYFNKEIFAFENRNHVDRTRDMKRPVYNAFIEWCESTQDINAYPWAVMDNRGYSNEGSKFYKIVDDFFNTNISETHETLLRLHKDKKQLSIIFNGNLVSEWTGLKGKELGIIINLYNQDHDLHWRINNFVYNNVDPKKHFCDWFSLLNKDKQ